MLDAIAALKTFLRELTSTATITPIVLNSYLKSHLGHICVQAHNIEENIAKAAKEQQELFQLQDRDARSKNNV